MKITLHILLLFIAIQPVTKDSRIQRFQDFLGKDRVMVIDQAVLLLDSIVTEKYKSKNITKNYQRLLLDLKKHKIDWYEMLDKQKMNRLDSLSRLSGLWQELYLDSQNTYLDDNEIVSTFIYTPNDSLTDSLSIESRLLIPQWMGDSLQIDSLIQAEKRKIEFNYRGKYIKALEQIQENDSVIINYVEHKYIAGTIPHSTLAHGFLYVKANLDDYFIKRILAIELLL